MASFAFLLLTPRSPLALASISHWTNNRFHRLPQPHSTILLPASRISLGRGNVSNDVVLFGSQEGEDGGWIALQHCVLRSIEGTSLLILNRSASPSTCYKTHDADDAWKMIRPGDEVAIPPRTIALRIADGWDFDLEFLPVLPQSLTRRSPSPDLTPKSNLRNILSFRSVTAPIQDQSL